MARRPSCAPEQSPALRYSVDHAARTRTIDLSELLTVAGVSIASTAAAGAAAFRFLGSWGFDELSARNKVRREFAAATGTQVAELANKHYWAVANSAGTLSVGLRDYLRRVELSLYLDHADSSELQSDVGKVANDAAASTLISLMRFLWALDDFQFQGSNDYLLPHYSAGRQLRRLYNEFRASIQPEDGSHDDLAALIIKAGKDASTRAEVEATYEADLQQVLDEAAAVAAPAADPSGKLSGSVVPDTVASLWRNWLRDHLPQVIAAAAVLQAFSRLLQHELADLYGDWFRDLRSDDEIDAVQDAVEQESWPGMLGGRDLAIIAAASEQSDFFSALSKASRSPKTTEPPEAPGVSDPAQHDQLIDSAGSSSMPPSSASDEGKKAAVATDASRFVIHTAAT